MCKPKRDIPSLIKSHEMDSERITLFVEGQEDRHIIEYLADENKNDDASIYEISSIEFPDKDIEGGEKGKIIYLSNRIKEFNLNIYFFVDSDFDRVLDNVLPNNVIQTDYRDIESYLYEKDYFKKFIKVGLKTDKIDENYLWTEIGELKKNGFLRLCSELNKLKLPFQKVNENFSRYYKVNPDLSTEFLFERYLNVLIQKCDNKISNNDLNSMLNEIIDDYAHLSEKDIVHGKDALNAIKEIAKKIGKSKDNIEAVFWMSFDREKIKEHQNLNAVINLVSNVP